MHDRTRASSLVNLADWMCDVHASGISCIVGWIVLSALLLLLPKRRGSSIRTRRPELGQCITTSLRFQQYPPYQFGNMSVIGMFSVLGSSSSYACIKITVQ